MFNSTEAYAFNASKLTHSIKPINADKNVYEANKTTKAAVQKYAPMLYTLLILLLIDFLLNAFNELAKTTSITMLVLYM